MAEVISEECLQKKLKESLQIIRKYDWLIDACVYDFYANDHWSKLPKSWQKHFEDLQPEDLTFLMNKDVENVLRVWPLELLALRQLRKDLIIPRYPEVPTKASESCLLLHHPKFRNVLKKSIKYKKRHEITRMAAFCKRSMNQTPVDFLVDFGAGVGHLGRLLGYGYGIKVCCLEREKALSQQASAHDLRWENMASQYLSPAERDNFQRPTHLVLNLTEKLGPQEFLSQIRKALGGYLSSNDYSFGIIGLHSCGDLGAILINMFLACSQAKFINFVGCCYMKLSTRVENTGAIFVGYPLSQFLNFQYFTSQSHLSYASREISCHIEEVYSQRLLSHNYENLKIHVFRASAEEIFSDRYTMLRNGKLCSVKYAPGMTFEEYFNKAITHLPMKYDCMYGSIDLRTTELQKVDAYLDNWHSLVIFYTLRLLFAPLIESIVLYDRILFLRENKCVVNIKAIFDPFLSPRNHITSAIKKS